LWNEEISLNGGPQEAGWIACHATISGQPELVMPSKFFFNPGGREGPYKATGRGGSNPAGGQFVDQSHIVLLTTGIRRAVKNDVPFPFGLTAIAG
jgi:hypothetical protein